MCVNEITKTNINEDLIAKMPLNKLRQFINKYNDNNSNDRIGVYLPKHKGFKKFIKKEKISEKSHLVCCPICNKINQDIKLFKCGGCNQIYYCSKEHQKQDWDNHKPMCKSISNIKKHKKTCNLSEEEMNKEKKEKKYMKDIQLSFNIEQGNKKQRKRVFHREGLIFKCVDETEENYIIEVVSISDFKKLFNKDNNPDKKENYKQVIHRLNNGFNVIIYKNNITIIKLC